MAVGVLNWAMSNVLDEQYKIITLDGKVDSLEIINLKHQHKTRIQRWDIKFKIHIFEKALYTIAKHKPEKFRELYQDMKNFDSEFFTVASNVLSRIKREYEFN